MASVFVETHICVVIPHGRLTIIQLLKHATIISSYILSDVYHTIVLNQGDFQTVCILMANAIRKMSWKNILAEFLAMFGSSI